MAWLPVWLVAAATVAGLVYVLSAERETASPGSPEEVAERTAPVGRLSLAQPVQAARAAAPANLQSTPSSSAPEPGTGGESVPVEPGPAATAGPTGDKVSSETRGSRAEAPEAQTPAAPGDLAPPAPPEQPEFVDKQQTGTEPVTAGRDSETAALDAVADSTNRPVPAEGIPAQHPGEPVPMRLVPRPHLPGEPYQLVPAPVDDRRE